MYNTVAINVRGIDNPDEVFSKIEHALRDCFYKKWYLSLPSWCRKIKKDFMPDTISVEGSIKLIQNIKKSSKTKKYFWVLTTI